MSSISKFRLWQDQRKRAQGSLAILTYHAVTTGKPPLSDWCFLSLKKFSAQMEALHHLGVKVLPLGDAVSALLEGTLRNRCVAITFDDGYKNNIGAALPVLKKFQFPATIFLVTSLVGGNRTLWSNRVISAVENAKCAAIEFRGRRYDLSTPSERRLTSRELQRAVKETAGADPSSAAREIELACGTPLDPEFTEEHDFSILDENTIRKAACEGLIEFGAHTATHPILSKLSDDALNKEIMESVARVESLTGHPCRTFAYPNGAAQDFDSRAIELLIRAKVKYAVTTVQAGNHANADPYRLTRWDVGSDVSLPRFVATVSGFQPLNLRRLLWPKDRY